MKEIIKNLSEKHKTQTDCYEEELWDSLEALKAKKVAEGLNVDKHRWYERSTIVYELVVNGETKYLGVNCATDLFSENSSWEDLYASYCFFEMTQINKPTYVEKEEK